MNIEDLLKVDYPHVRVLVGDKWLYWDNEWVVLTHPYRARESTCLYRGEPLDKAIEALLE